MRYLQIITVLIFVLSLLFTGWANSKFYSNRNTDYPVLTNSAETLEISVNDPPEAMLQGLQAKDATDGDLTDEITPIADVYKRLGIDFDAIYTGYLGSFRQLALVEQFIDDFKKQDTVVLVDPVMADDGVLYDTLRCECQLL